jgi:hypothetical protein
MSWTRIAKLLKLDKAHAMVVLTKADEQVCVDLKNVFGMEFINIESFVKKINEVIKK